MRLYIWRPDKDRQETWQRWYAWRPVFAENIDDPSGCVLVWREFVERKEAIGYGGRWVWRHRECANSSQNTDKHKATG